jgi:cold shock CspA family protein
MKHFGIVSAFFPSRKFGFILLDDKSSRFFHLSNCPNGIPVLGERVEFELGDPVKLGRDKQAVNITPVSITSETDVLDALAGVPDSVTDASSDVLR